MPYELVQGEQVEPHALNAFLQRVYPAHLAAHIYTTTEPTNRFAIRTEAGQIAAYSGALPLRYSVAGQQHEGVWWVNLIVDPAHRGQGLARRLAAVFKQMPRTCAAFTNAASHAILAKEGWQPYEYRTLLLPLRPRHLKIEQHLTGWKAAAGRAGAVGVSPVFALLRRRMAAYRPRHTQRITQPDPAALAALYHTHMQPRRLITTIRDAAYLRRRYLEGPTAEQIRVYLGADVTAMVTRTLTDGSGIAVRILDVFGALGDTALLADMTRTVMRDAAQQGAYQVTTMTSLPGLRRMWQRLGFLIGVPQYFNWHHHQPHMMRLYEEAPAHWVLGDSDNDAPVA